MPLDEAIGILHGHKGATPSLLAFTRALSDRAAAGRGASRSSRKAAASRGHEVLGGAAQLESALGTLNRLLADAEQQKDLECRQCTEFRERQQRILEDMRRDMAIDTADATEAHRDIVAAENEIDAVRQRVFTAQEMVGVLGRRCAAEVGTLRAHLAAIRQDVKLLESTAGVSSCRSQRLLLLRRCRGRAARLRSGGRRLLQAAAAGGGHARRAWTPLAARRRAWCSFRRNPTCQHVQEHFLQMQAETAQQRDAVQGELQAAVAACEKARRNYGSEIDSFEVQSKDEQARLANAIAGQNLADERVHVKASQMRALEAHRAATMRRCLGKVQGIEREICGLRKIRAELQIMQGKDTYILDCQVSEWVREECSASCGGGTQRLRRSVTVHPRGGAACPPLEGVQRCGEEPCPVHCRLGAWGDWSACSAGCGGGVRERIRGVVEKPRHNGDPCGETVSAETCNMQYCDRDCALAPWAPWSSCSRSCGGGLRSRARPVARAAVGAGRCPGARNHLRLQYLACNAKACAHNASSPALRCNRKLDVVLLLNGGTAAWQQVKKATEKLAGTLDGGDEGVQVAVQTFGGPRSLAALKSCTGSGGSPVDLLGDCGIQWVSHFTPEVSSVAAKIDKLEPPSGSPLTSAALVLAKEELTLGRRGAERVVVVVTDRRPVSTAMTRQVALRLRKVARLVWVPVTRHAPLEYLKTLASRPLRDNLVFVPDVATLPQDSTVEAILGVICPAEGR